jgi:hypothetical protein
MINTMWSTERALKGTLEKNKTCIENFENFFQNFHPFLPHSKQNSLLLLSLFAGK